jgi:LysR family transcriptional regulator, nitrogen assimilation regulatory protein
MEWEKTMELNDLKLFLSVAAGGSFSRGAQLSGVTQSAISKRILDLELLLGQRLFVRHGRGAALSEAGRLLVQHAESLLREADALPQILRGALAPLQGEVRLAMQASISWPLMQHLQAELVTRHPDIRLQVVEAPTRQIVELIQEGRVDVGVLSDWGPEKLPQTEALFSSRLLLIGPPSDPLLAGRNIRFSRVLALPLIVSPMPNGARVLVEAAAREAAGSLHVAMEMHSVHLIKKMVHAGWGYTVALRESVQEELLTHSLSACPISMPAMSQRFYLSVGNRRKASGAIGLVAGLIRQWRPDQSA